MTRKDQLCGDLEVGQWVQQVQRPCGRSFAGTVRSPVCLGQSKQGGKENEESQSSLVGQGVNFGWDSSEMASFGEC